MLESIKHPNLRKPQTVPPMCPPGFSINSEKPNNAQLTPNMGKHSAKREPGAVPPRESGTPIKGFLWGRKTGERHIYIYIYRS